MSEAGPAKVDNKEEPPRGRRPDPEGIIFVEGSWDVRQTYHPDPMIIAMFDGFRRKQILASRIQGSGRVVFPPRSVCEVSYRDADGMVEVGPCGTIRTFTIVHSKFGNAPPTPHIIVFVQLDGAGTAAGGYLRGVSTEPEHSLTLIGRRVRAVFTPEPTGDWTDFWYELEEQE